MLILRWSYSVPLHASVFRYLTNGTTLLFCLHIYKGAILSDRKNQYQFILTWGWGSSKMIKSNVGHNSAMYYYFFVAPSTRFTFWGGEAWAKKWSCGFKELWTRGQSFGGGKDCVILTAVIFKAVTKNDRWCLIYMYMSDSSVLAVIALYNSGLEIWLQWPELLDNPE